MTKRLLSAIRSAPFAVLLASVSAAVSLVVAISTLSAGQVPGNAPLELIAALLLAAVATSEASRPRRRDRDRQRVARSAGGENLIGDADELGPTEWLRVDRDPR